MSSRNLKEDPRRLACINEILAVCKRHGYSLSHEDGQGAFELVVPANTKEALYYESWLRAAATVWDSEVIDSWRDLSTLPDLGVDVLVLERGLAPKIAARALYVHPFRDWFWDDHNNDGGGSNIVTSDVTHWKPLVDD